MSANKDRVMRIFGIKILPLSAFEDFSTHIWKHMQDKQENKRPSWRERNPNTVQWMKTTMSGLIGTSLGVIQTFGTGINR